MSLSVRRHAGRSGLPGNVIGAKRLEALEDVIRVIVGWYVRVDDLPVHFNLVGRVACMVVVDVGGS